MYFDHEFSDRFVKILSDEIGLPETRTKLWDEILAEHIDDVCLSAKVFAKDVVHEFDYVGDLVAFDRDFFTNVDSCILDNICSTLACTREEITSVEPVSAGLTNLSVLLRFEETSTFIAIQGAARTRSLTAEPRRMPFLWRSASALTIVLYTKTPMRVGRYRGT